MIQRLLLISILFVAITHTARAEGSVAEGAKKIAICTACHGKDGNLTVKDGPKLAGQHEAYLLTQLQEYKKGNEGSRYSPIMSPLVANLGAQDLADMAAYYASQKLKIGKADPKLVKRGQQLYRGGDMVKQIPACTACHGPDGAGNGLANFPRLSGQNAEYIVEELEDYKKGSRTNDVNGIMRDIAKRMDKEDMEAVASYIQGLH